MSLIFLMLKASRIFESPYDWPIGLALLDLDLMALAEWRRLWLHGRGR